MKARSGLVGNWGQINVHLRNLQRARTKERPLLSIANVIAMQVKKNIEAQSLDFIPLNEEYRDWKIRQGYDERILIMTGEFVDSIVVKDVQVDGDTYVVEVGVKEGTTQSGVDLQELARWLEYGTVRMPGRYPFTMTWESMKEKLKQEIVNQIKMELQGGP